jgi:hypothetical protein
VVRAGARNVPMSRPTSRPANRPLIRSGGSSAIPSSATSLPMMAIQPAGVCMPNVGHTDVRNVILMVSIAERRTTPKHPDRGPALVSRPIRAWLS